ncbi:MAG: translocation/assembly module TamB domain-containing protein, partial [Pseudomonadota bacterium]
LNGQADIALSPPEPAGLFPSTAPDSPLAGAANGTVDLSQLAALVPPAIDRLEGQLDLDIALDGTIGAPTVTGAATLANGIIEQRELGFLITDVSAQVDGAVDQVILQSLTGRFVDGGELTANAAVDLDQLPAIPVQAEMRLGRSRVLDGDLATVDMQGGITLTGVLAEAARLEGGFTIDDAEFRIPDSLPVSVVDLPVREKGAPVETQGEPTEAALIATTLVLDVGISAPSQVFVRGRGIDTELGGDLTITGTAAEPDIVGGFDLRRGRLSVLTQTLTVDRGRIGFDGAAPDDPTLDLVASTQVENTLAQVVVSGTASAPEFNFTSEPVLPEDEVASLILFGQSSAELSPFQALQLASAVAELTGRGPGFADRVRSGLGLDELTVTEGETGPSLRAGRYVSERVFVGVDRGLGSGGESSVSVEVELNDNITVESDVGARNSGQVGINFRLDY